MDPAGSRGAQRAPQRVLTFPTSRNVWLMDMFRSITPVTNGTGLLVSIAAARNPTASWGPADVLFSVQTAEPDYRL